MSRITTHGTFIYCKGIVMLDGWQVDCEGGEVLTQEEITKLVMQFLYAAIVEAPELKAKLESLQALQRARGDVSEGGT